MDDTQIIALFLASICRHISLNRLDWKLAAKRMWCP